MSPVLCEQHREVPQNTGPSERLLFLFGTFSFGQTEKKYYYKKEFFVSESCHI